MKETPDSWIERNEDEGPPMTDGEMCEEGRCDHDGHCDQCGRGVYGDEAVEGVCMACQIQLVSKGGW